MLHKHLGLAGVSAALALLAGCARDRKSTRLNSSHSQISYAVFCLKKKKTNTTITTITPQKNRQPLLNSPFRSVPASTTLIYSTPHSYFTSLTTTIRTSSTFHLAC